MPKTKKYTFAFAGDCRLEFTTHVVFNKKNPDKSQEKLEEILTKIFGEVCGVFRQWGCKNPEEIFELEPYQFEGFDRETKKPFKELRHLLTAKNIVINLAAEEDVCDYVSLIREGSARLQTRLQPLIKAGTILFTADFVDSEPDIYFSGALGSELLSI
jgi:hypothetical protein